MVVDAEKYTTQDHMKVEAKLESKNDTLEEVEINKLDVDKIFIAAISLKHDKSHCFKRSLRRRENIRTM